MATPRARNKTTPRKTTSRGASSHSSRASAEPPSLNPDHLKGFALGALGGLIIGVASMAWLTTTNEQPATALSDPVITADPSGGPKPRYDFFTVLPNQELDLASDVEPAGLSDNASDADLYLLQAGSFRLQTDADRRRGELALLGLTATIEETRGDNGIWFRVYVGPFESRSAMARARSITAQQSIDTLLLKRPRNP